MKKISLVLIVILLLGLCACNNNTSSEPDSTYNYIYSPQQTETTSSEADLTQETSSNFIETTTQYILTEIVETTSQEETVTVQETTTPTEPTEPVSETTTQNIENETQDVTEKETTTAVSSENIALNVSVPEANGTMQVDLSADNVYTQKVVSDRNVDASYLVAVFSVPESGQNYVFEFSVAGAQNRTADNLKKVYLIDSNGDIVSVAASNGSEAENISAIENWFCMNVLIKGMILPAIEEQMK